MSGLQLFFIILAALITHDLLSIGLALLISRKEQKKMQELQDKMAQDLQEGKVPEGLEFMFPNLYGQPPLPTTSGDEINIPHGHYL